MFKVIESEKLLLVSRSRLKNKGDRAFATAGPKLWNSLPVYIRTTATESLCKTRLKAYLFERTFSVWANRSLLFQIIICLSCFIILCILIPFKLYCSAQWSTIAVLLCFINNNTNILYLINTNTMKYIIFFNKYYNNTINKIINKINKNKYSIIFYIYLLYIFIYTICISYIQYMIFSLTFYIRYKNILKNA